MAGPATVQFRLANGADAVWEEIYRHKVIVDQLNVDAIDTSTSHVDKNGIFLHKLPQGAVRRL